MCWWIISVVIGVIAGTTVTKTRSDIVVIGVLVLVEMALVLSVVVLLEVFASVANSGIALLVFLFLVVAVRILFLTDLVIFKWRFLCLGREGKSQSSIYSYVLFTTNHTK